MPFHPQFRYVFGLLCCLLSVTAFAQSPDKPKKVVKGKVINQEDTTAAPFIHIINTSSQFGTSSNEDGSFKMYINPGDTLIFSGVQFQQDTVVVNELPENDFMLVELQPATIEMDPVSINELPPEDVFKKDFLAYRPEKEEKIHIPGSYEGPRREYEPGAGSPISYIFSKFDKSVKERKKYNKVVKQGQRNKVIESKYNRDLVAKLTLLKGESVDRFMVFCDFNEEFLYKSSQYDIAMAVTKKLKDFQKQHPELLPDTLSINKG